MHLNFFTKTLSFYSRAAFEPNQPQTWLGSFSACFIEGEAKLRLGLGKLEEMATHDRLRHTQNNASTESKANVFGSTPNEHAQLGGGRNVRVPKAFMGASTETGVKNRSNGVATALKSQRQKPEEAK